MSRETPRGWVYRCPVCKAEVAVLSYGMGDFRPRCCNVDMVKVACRIGFYVCPICRAEIAVLIEGTGPFAPRCCNVPMTRLAA